MTSKQILRITFTALATTLATSAVAAPNKDAAALKKIDEAVNVHYIAAEFDKAEAVLLAAIKMCGAKSCSGEVVAKAYIYVGVVRGNGKQDLAGAREAFENARASDPNVTLDPTLATPAVLAEFNKVIGNETTTAQPKSTSASEGQETEPSGAKKPGQDVAPVGDLRCSPATGYEVQTARPIPINCEKLEGIVRGELYYKPIGAEDYSAVLMKFDSVTGTLRAQVPCEALAKQGTLDVYVIGQDANKNMVDSFGSAPSPIEYKIVAKTSQPAPSYPGERAPDRCTDIFAATTGPAEACSAEIPCRKGNYCHEGFCRKTPGCDWNADCDSNHCVDGLCEMPEDSASKKGFNRWMVGVNVAADLWISAAANNVCGGNNAGNGTYNCYNSGSYKINVSSDPQTTNRLPMAADDYGGNVKTTLVPSTFRALASVDYALTPSVTAGARLGMAFNGGPPTIHYDQGVPSQNKGFFPVHAELRGAYWFTPLDTKGTHPFVGVGLGLAEVDAKITVNAYAYGPNDPPGRPSIKRPLDGWRKLGRTFAALSFGGLQNLGGHHNLLLNVNVMYMVPSSGIVLEPSLGYVFGF